MMDAIWWALSQSIKVLGIVGAWLLFKTIVTSGKGTIADLLETISMGIEAGCLKLKRKFFDMIKREKVGPEKPTEAEGTVK